MAAFRNIKTWARLLFVLLVSGSCDPWFSYSPYETELDQSYHGITVKQLEKIKATDANDSKPFRIALLSDAHYHFSKLDDALTHINKSNDFDFVIVIGDLTDNGLIQEFIFFNQTMEQLKIPYLTVIGNHDYLSNGAEVYTQMFGPFNYSFIYNNVKFVLFDNVRWESNKVPDLAWFESELNNDHGYDHVIPLSHIPPYDGQMKEFHKQYHALMVRNGIGTSIHGHRHEFSLEDVYGDGTRYLTVSSPQYRVYTALTVTPDKIEIEKIEY